MHVLTVDVPHLGNRTPPGARRAGRRGDRPAARHDRGRGGRRRRQGVDIVAVAETHIHNDYVSGGLCLSQRHGAEYLVAADEEVEFDRIGVRDNETLAFGDLDLRVIATPGHTPLHVSFLATDAAAGDGAAGALFSGGSLLHGTVGRTDLVDPALTTALARAQWLSARRLGALPADTVAAPDPRLRQLLRERARRRRPDGHGHDRRPARRQPRPDDTARDTFVTEPARRLRAGARATTPTWRRATGRAPGRRVRAPGSTRDARARRPGPRRAGRRRAEQRATTRTATCRGSLAIPAGPQCAVYAGWVTPWGAELVVPLRLRGRARRRWRASSPRSASRASRPRSLEPGRGARVDRVSSYRLGRVRRRAARTDRRRPGRTPPRGVARRAPRRRPQHRRPRAAPAARRDPAPARSGCTAPPATARRSPPVCSTAPAATSCWSTTTSRRSASSGFPCSRGSRCRLSRELRGPRVRGPGPAGQLRPQQRQEHRVGAVPVRPQLDRPGEVRRRGVLGLRHQRRRVLEAYVAPAGQHGLDHAGRLGDHRRAGRVEHHSPGPHRVERTRRAAHAAAARGPRGPPGVVATGSPGAGAGHPVPSTERRRAPGRRSPSGHGGRVPSPTTTSPPVARSAWATSSGAVRLALVGQQPGTALVRQCGEQCRLAAGSGAQVQPAFVAALDARPGTGPVRPAASRRPARRRARPGPPGSRRGRRTRGPRRAARGVGAPPQLLDRRQTRVAPPGSPAGARCRPRAAPRARRAGRGPGPARLDHPRRVREPHGLRGVEQVHPRVEVALGDPAHHRVGEAGRLVADPVADQLDRAGDRGVVGHPHREHLMGAETERVADGRVGCADRRGGR